VHEFTQSEHAALTVVCGEIQRCGFCAWCIAKVAAIAGVCRTVVKNAIRKARAKGLMHREERRRRGQKSLTNIVRTASGLGTMAQKGRRQKNDHHSVRRSEKGCGW
jgi:GTP-sensing pleiotropic transcriptional regulator CodY